MGDEGKYKILECLGKKVSNALPYSGLTLELPKEGLNIIIILAHCHTGKNTGHRSSPHREN